jgi:antitoxin component YwqK of YwqJK toxin-antitoxin module
MRLTYILIINLFFIVLFSCSEEQESKARIIWDKYDNGNYKTVHQYFTDTANLNDDYYYKEFYENGTLKVQGIENRKKRDGEWKYYHNNSKLKAKLNFENNKISGPIILFDQNGELKAKDILTNGRLTDNNTEIVEFLSESYKTPENRPEWLDSLFITVDSINNIMN